MAVGGATSPLTTFVSTTTLTAVTPAHTPGTVDVSVTNLNGTGILAGAFVYDTPPTLVSIAPTSGSPLGGERDAFEASCFQGRGRKRDFNMRNIRSKMVAFCCIDDAGARIFSDADVDQLGAVRADILDRLFGVAQRLSGMRDEDVEELGSPSETQTTPDTGSSLLP